MTREEAIEQLQNCKELIFQNGKDWLDERDIPLIDMAISALSAEAVHKPDYSYEADMVMRLREYEHGWIPFTRRPMTEEEQEDYPDCTFIFDCVLPDDGDEILVSNGRFVWMDTFCVDDGCYLDGGDDIDEDMAWMPLPTPYKGGDE